MIQDRLKDVRRRISIACGRSGRPAGDVRLVAVTKEAAADEISEAISLGVTDIGENRVQDALAKYRTIGDKAIWHLIGHLQTNKAKDAVKIFSLIHSVDSLKLAAEINKEAAKLGKVQQVLVQVNISGEESKFGIEPPKTADLIKAMSIYPNISIGGLMTVAPEVEDPEEARPHLRKLKELKDKIGGLEILSMGMTNDFEIAIEEGSTMVRIGRAIFK